MQGPGKTTVPYGLPTHPILRISIVSFSVQTIPMCLLACCS